MSALPIDDNEGQEEQPVFPRSARLMGQDHGMTGAEMNFLLKEEGFLEGEPGAYRVTPKGQPYANERIDGRGTGGSLQYNPSWGLRSWNRAIEDELHITPERKREVREAAAAERRQRAEMKAAAAAPTVPNSTDDHEASDSNLNLDALKVAGGLALAAAAVYGVWKVTPHVKRLYKNTLVPGAKNLKRRITDRSAPRSGDGGDEGPAA